MGLIEELTSAVLGGGGRSSGVSNDQVGALIKSVLESLGGEGDDAGVEGLDRRFQQGGSGDVFSSWVGTGSNRSIGPDILSQILKGHPIEQAPQRAGLGGAAGAVRSSRSYFPRWTYGDGQLVNEQSQQIAPTGPSSSEFHISKPDGWPAGTYKVEILADGTSVASKNFEVK